MNYVYMVILSILSFPLCAHYITYELSGGRLGDNLVACARAEYFALRHGLTVVHKEFPYSQGLQLHTYENPNNIPKSSIKVQAERDLYNLPKNKEYLFELPWFSEIAHERRLPWNRNWIHMDINWDDPLFKKRLQEIMSPLEPLELIIPPSDCFSIAIHLRRGGNFDGKLRSEASSDDQSSEFCDTNVPMKFPPLSFYIDALKILLPLILEENIYVFLFTDDLNPAQLCEKFVMEFNGIDKHIRFEARINEPNNEQLNVLEDLFSMLQFHALIRPDSNYSIMAAHLGNFMYELYPLAHHWDGNYSCIDKIGIAIKK